MRIRKLILYAVYAVILGTTVIATFSMIPATVRYHITERYTFSGATTPVLIALGVVIPRSGPYQTVTAPTVSWHGEQEARVEHGLSLLLLTGALEPDATVVATADYEVTLRQGPVRWKAPTLPAHTAPQHNIEADAATLVAQARTLTGRDSAATAWDIFRYTAARLRWPTGTRANTEPSALTAYETGVGGCAEFANLMVALCRGAGVPAVTVSGLAFFPLMPPFIRQTATWNHPAGAHAWVEVYTGEAWTFADPSWASQHPIKRLQYARTDGAHLSYGEVDHHDRMLAELKDWAEERGSLIGGMSAPLRFTAAAAAEQGAPAPVIVPAASVTKTWDGRWPAAAATYIILVLAFALVKRRLSA